MTLKTLKHHKDLQPLLIIMSMGMTLVCAFCVRTATKATEVNWSKREEPYEFYRHRQFKLINAKGHNYEELGNNIPNYKGGN